MGAAIVTERAGRVVGAATLSLPAGDLGSLALNAAIGPDAEKVLAGQLGYAACEFAARGARIIRVDTHSAAAGSAPIEPVCDACGVTDLIVRSEHRFGLCRTPAGVQE